ncbi:GntR family transcriptional regulator, partial [Mannheimia haemolytica]
YTKIGKILKEEIAQGKYRVGDKLPTERDISERFEVSRTIVREAIVMLEVEKLIEVKKGSGVYVIRVPELFPEDFPEEKDNELRDVGPF